PIDLLRAGLRDQRVEVGAILRQRVFVRVAQPPAAAAPDQIRADDAAPGGGETTGEEIEVAALARETVHAHHRHAPVGRTPFDVSEMMIAGERETAERTETI